MSGTASEKKQKSAKNDTAPEKASPLADVVVADGQTNEPHPAADPAPVQGDDLIPLNVRAVSENGFWRCGRFWSHAGEDVDVTAAVAARLKWDPDLIVTEREKR